MISIASVTSVMNGSSNPAFSTAVATHFGIENGFF